MWERVGKPVEKGLLGELKRRKKNTETCLMELRFENVN
jgi:hypothetical protein